LVHGHDPSKRKLQIDPHDIIRVELVGYRSVANAGDHGGQFIAALDEILGADGIVKALTNREFAEFDALTGDALLGRLERLRGRVEGLLGGSLESRLLT